jgi:hypothetical protein
MASGRSRRFARASGRCEGVTKNLGTPHSAVDVEWGHHAEKGGDYMNPYERPEIVELGDAGDLTLGMVKLDVTDGCDCTKCGGSGGGGDDGGGEDPILQG